MHEPHPLDIPEFLRRDKSETRAHGAGPVSRPRDHATTKRPPGWYALTRAEQNGTADAATVALRAQLEADAKTKRAARFAALKAMNEERKRNGTPVVRKPRVPKANKIGFTAKRRRKSPVGERRLIATSSNGVTEYVKTKNGTVARYGVITEGGVAFSFDAKGGDDARQIFSAMRKRGEVKGLKVKSLRKLKPDDHAVGGGPVPHKGGAQ